MNTAIALPRINFTLPSIAAALQITKEAEATLGYSALSARVNDMRLLALLAKHDALLFVPAAVRDYQKQQLWKARGWNINPFTRYRMCWRACSIGRFMGVIPLEILERMNKLVAEATAYSSRVPMDVQVSYLADHELERIEPVDPFICVRATSNLDKNPNPWHYIAVWDEPDFKF